MYTLYNAELYFYKTLDWVGLWLKLCRGYLITLSRYKKFVDQLGIV